MSGDKGLAQDVALRYLAKKAAHQNLEVRALNKKELYGKKAKDWNHIADEKQREIDLDERMKHDHDERKKKEAAKINPASL